ncbi:MAG: UDP-glucose--hexose-1-phosphate uridylyltransferase [Bacteroidota bacterium]
MTKELNASPHRRYNPLTDSWVLVSPHRAQRPWQGQVEKLPADTRPAHDPNCYLCAGNVRANGAQTPDYEDVFVFDNDFAALLPPLAPPEGGEASGLALSSDQLISDSQSLDTYADHVLIPHEINSTDPLEGSNPKPSPPSGGPGGGLSAHETLFIARPEHGIARVICFSPRHDLTMAQMETADIRKVVDAWVDEYRTLGAKSFINYVQIFENKGAIMGCSNPHPHGQIWAQESVPDEPMKKQIAQLKYWGTNNSSLLLDYIKEELVLNERILFENEHFVTLVPFWAVWPFEAMIVPKRHLPRITDMTDEERTGLADAYRRLTALYDRLFDTSFPYSSGIHQAPTDGEPHEEWHFHFVFYPPLLRSATVKKFMVGYEMLANPQRDITPEKAAEMLRGLLDA